MANLIIQKFAKELRPISFFLTPRLNTTHDKDSEQSPPEIHLRESLWRTRIINGIRVREMLCLAQQCFPSETLIVELRQLQRFGRSRTAATGTRYRCALRHRKVVSLRCHAIRRHMAPSIQHPVVHQSAAHLWFHLVLQLIVEPSRLP